MEKDLSSDHLKVKSIYNVPENCCKNFERSIGKHVIERIIYKEQIAIVHKDGNKDDYEDLRLKDDYTEAVVVRLEVETRPLGYTAFYFDKPFEITEQVKKLLLAIANIFSESMRKDRIVTLLNELRRIDPETGLYFNNYFFLHLKSDLEKSKRNKNPLTLVIMDMDNYKEVMNLYGTAVALQLYKEVAEELKSCLRGIDIIGRYGIDEFILYLPNTSLENASVVINRFIEHVTNKIFTEKHLTCSLSYGVASCNADYSFDDLISSAQTALYNAKITGKGLAKYAK
ncbi:Diguanylate cyclase, predicted domain protein [Candidatus Magnetoovum chiemensis]|nr:Diguanylate cyclase, predicted domain protein [Candidatus Magnetoovum chiemensis]